MIRRLFAPALMLLIAVAAGGCSAERGKRTDSSGSEPRVQLQMRYPPGRYSMVRTTDLSMQVETKLADKEQRQAINVQMSLELSLDVKATDAKGVTVVTMRFVRIKQEVDGGPITMSFDTNDRASLTGHPVARFYAELLGVTLVMRLDGNGKPLGVTGIDALWERMGRSDPAIARAAGQLKQQFSEQVMSDMISQEMALFPTEPVGVGGIWHVRTPLPMPMLGRMDCTYECELTKLDETPGGKTATIETYATLTGKSGQPAVGPIGARIDAVDMEFTGSMKLDATTGLLAQCTVDVTGSLSVTKGQAARQTTTAMIIEGTMETRVAPLRAASSPPKVR